MSLDYLSEIIRSVDVEKLAQKATVKAATTAATKLVNEAIFARAAQKELEGAFVSGLAVAAERARMTDPDEQLMWWSEHGRTFFEPFESNKNIIAVVSRCAMAHADSAEIKGLLHDALTLSGNDPPKFEADHQIDLDHFADILPTCIIDAIIYTGSGPSSRLTGQAQLAVLARHAAQLSESNIPPLSSRDVRGQLTQWCTREAARHRKNLSRLPYLRNHPDPTRLDVEATTRVGLRRRTLETDDVYAPAAGRFTTSDAHTATYANVTDNSNQVVVLGDPGAGKSWVTQMHAIRLADAAALKLADPQVDPDGIDIPLSVRCDAIAAAVGGDLPEAATAVLAQLDTAMTAGLRRWLQEHCRSGPTTYLLDALDETPADARDAVIRMIDDQTNSVARTIVTSRIAGYSSGLLDPQTWTEVELLPFTDPQAYIASWHLHVDREHELKQRLQTAALATMAQIPLLLALLCHLASDPEERLPRTRAEIYSRILRRFLRREHRAFTGAVTASLPSDPHERERLLLDILRPLAFKIADSPDGWLDRIPDTTLQAHLASIQLPANISTAAAITILSNDAGVLVPDGDTREGRNPPFLFVHRTFAEYLVAEHLAIHQNLIDDCLDARLYLEPSWREVWILVACLAPAGVMSKLVDRRPDPLHIALSTAAAAVAEFDDDLRGKVSRSIGSLLAESSTLLRHPTAHREVRKTAALALGYVGGRAAIEVLSQTLNQDADLDVRWWAADALGRIGGSDAIEVLCRMLIHPDPRLQMSTVGALRYVGTRAVIDVLSQTLNQDTDLDDYWRAADALHRFRPDGIDILRQTLIHPDTDLSLRETAAGAHARIGGPDIIDVLRQTLTDPKASPQVHWRAADLLCLIDDGPDTIDVLRQTLTDPKASADLRETAAGALGRIGGPDTIDVLRQTLTDRDTDLSVRRVATASLGGIGGPEAIDVLRQTLTDRNTHLDLRGTAALALGTIGGPEAIDVLRQTLTDPNTDLIIRRVAASELGEIGDPEAIDVLRQTLTDTDSDLRWRAAYLLGKIGGPEAITTLRRILTDPNTHPIVRRSAAEALGKIGGPEAITPLRRILTDPNTDSNLRKSAAEALGKIGGPEAITTLRRILTDPNTDSNLRKSAAEALGKIGGPEAITTLRRILTDPNTDSNLRKSAIEALAHIGGYEFAEWLVEYVQGGDIDPIVIGPVFVYFRSEPVHRDLRSPLIQALILLTQVADDDPVQTRRTRHHGM
ncbi:HEAT repeat domain-containing protein [Rhodococcus sp. T7]|uniref:HEAT repeat domain-containing protein n=1 Tax=Rhodococcus sp. T7 TaxID=627444 RepID=UPI0013594ACC|nr:HEAT repeat domain-containing protein [Rhodococcus sp. T7]KAF0957418.1 hypothetical protein MLGJGCBP_09250 [Rhodococcus sp. T7]KAF0962111.1 hypothetical protein MLGJGCBP_04732 [Rhodococcus sp. T7]